MANGAGAADGHEATVIATLSTPALKQSTESTSANRSRTVRVDPGNLVRRLRREPARRPTDVLVGAALRPGRRRAARLCEPAPGAAALIDDRPGGEVVRPRAAVLLETAIEDQVLRVHGS